MRGGLTKKLTYFLLLVVTFLAGVGCTLLVSKTQTITKEQCAEQYPLTSISLDCATYNESTAKLQNLSNSLHSAVDRYISEHKATRVSVWIRDLEARQWAAVNENERYAPASLLKLPIMITYFKLAELEPSILEQKIIYTSPASLGTEDNSHHFAPENKLTEGQEYTVMDLINHMIIYSDNASMALLSSRIDEKIFTNTLVDLGIKIPTNTKTYDFVTVKSYATILRNLYNGSYLNREHSELALELMASSTFKAIAKPLPAYVVVADKFGEREVEDINGVATTRELHDCGVVYKKDRPYTLCIMTEGKDFDTLFSIIKDLSLCLPTTNSR